MSIGLHPVRGAREESAHPTLQGQLRPSMHRVGQHDDPEQRRAATRGNASRASTTTRIQPACRASRPTCQIPRPHRAHLEVATAGGRSRRARVAQLVHRSSSRSWCRRATRSAGCSVGTTTASRVESRNEIRLRLPCRRRMSAAGGHLTPPRRSIQQLRAGQRPHAWKEVAPSELKCRSRKDKMKSEQRSMPRFIRHKTVARCNLCVRCLASPRTSATTRALFFLSLTLAKGARSLISPRQ